MCNIRPLCMCVSSSLSLFHQSLNAIIYYHLLLRLFCLLIPALDEHEIHSKWSLFALLISTRFSHYLSYCISCNTLPFPSDSHFLSPLTLTSLPLSPPASSVPTSILAYVSSLSFFHPPLITYGIIFVLSVCPLFSHLLPSPFVPLALLCPLARNNDTYDPAQWRDPLFLLRLMDWKVSELPQLSHCNEQCTRSTVVIMRKVQRLVLNNVN